MTAHKGLEHIFNLHAEMTVSVERNWIRMTAQASGLPDLVRQLAIDWVFAGIVPENDPQGQSIKLLYVFYGKKGPWLGIEVRNHDQRVPTITDCLFSADWQEREMEDLYDVKFNGHPQLGDFVLHDSHWPEGTAPMNRHSWEIRQRTDGFQAIETPRIVDAPGAFLMPIGPIYSSTAESIQFGLETVGEEIILAHIRPFYKYRGVEKLLEGKPPAVAVIIAERIDGLTAFSHALAMAQAFESLAETQISSRNKVLRVFWAEIERLRSHVHVLAGILESTGLSVPTNLFQTLEEELLQLSGAWSGHRYLFGLIKPGGLSRNWSDQDIHAIISRLDSIVGQAKRLLDSLAFDNSFLDRLEAVGTLNAENALLHGLTGPVARASGLNRDLRIWQPYAAYDEVVVDTPVQHEGDGYARFRQFWQEIFQSHLIVQQIPHLLTPDVSRSQDEVRIREPHSAFGYAEGPSGALISAVSTNRQGNVERCRVITPGLINWHAFPESVRHFSFQDFPIILATFGLSVADLDR